MHACRATDACLNRDCCVRVVQETLVAGGLSGVTVDLILFPLDTIKTRLQARKLPGQIVPKTGAFYRGAEP